MNDTWWVQDPEDTLEDPRDHEQTSTRAREQSPQQEDGDDNEPVVQDPRQSTHRQGDNQHEDRRNDQRLFPARHSQKRRWDSSEDNDNDSTNEEWRATNVSC